MSIQVVVKGVGGTIWTEFVGRRVTSCNVSVNNGTSATPLVAAGVCTPDPVNTTITAAVFQDDETVALASVASVRSGRRYVIGNEEVSVKSVSGLNVTLWAPLTRDHTNGTAFQGTRVEYTVDAVAAATAWSDGYAIFTPNSGEAQVEALHCAKHKLPDVVMSNYDLRQFLPKDQASLSAELDIDFAFAQARENFLIDLGGKAVVNAIIGVAQFRRLVTMRFILDREIEFGQSVSIDWTKFREEYWRLIDRVVAVSPIDEDGDGGTVSGPEKHGFSGLDLEML